jgi:hypothetical protein
MKWKLIFLSVTSVVALLAIGATAMANHSRTPVRYKAKLQGARRGARCQERLRARRR